jgi:hypothetical protein
VSADPHPPGDPRPGGRNLRGALARQLPARPRHGENLNEHILGNRWPAADERLDMLEEAIDLIEELWSGEEVAFRRDD